MTMLPATLLQASVTQLDDLVPLFDAYRQFYGMAADQDGARTFLHDRISRGESMIHIAYVGADPAGFAGVFPTFSSVQMQPVWIVNDLYVRTEFRKRGIAQQLLTAIANEASQAGVKNLRLETARDNSVAQRVYERFGFQRSNNLKFEYFINCAKRISVDPV